RTAGALPGTGCGSDSSQSRCDRCARNQRYGRGEECRLRANRDDVIGGPSRCAPRAESCEAWRPGYRPHVDRERTRREAARNHEAASARCEAVRGNAQFWQCGCATPTCGDRASSREAQSRGRVLRCARSRGADQARTRHQSQDSQGDWGDDTARASGAGRRGDSVTVMAATGPKLMSAYDPKQTFISVRRTLHCVLVLTAALALVTTSCTAHAQQDPKKRVGLLRPGAPPDPYVEAFRQGLRDLGYVEGQNVAP